MKAYSHKLNTICSICELSDEDIFWLSDTDRYVCPKCNLKVSDEFIETTNSSHRIRVLYPVL